MTSASNLGDKKQSESEEEEEEEEPKMPLSEACDLLAANFSRFLIKKYGDLK